MWPRSSLFVVSCLIAVYLCAGQTPCNDGTYTYANTSLNSAATLAFYQSLAPQASNLMALFTFDDYDPTTGNATNLADSNAPATLCPTSPQLCYGFPTLPDYTAPGICGLAPQFNHFWGNGFYVDQNLNPTVVPKMTWGAWVKPSYNTINNGISYAAVLSTDNGDYDRKIASDVRGNKTQNSVCTNGAVAGNFTTGHFAVNLGFTGGNGFVGGVEPCCPDFHDPCRQIPDEEWHFVAATYDQTTNSMTFYVGQSLSPTLSSMTYTAGSVFGPTFYETNGDAPGSAGYTTQTFWTIGTSPCLTCGGGYDGEFWNGLIDEVFLYDVELTGDQIQEIYDFARLDSCITYSVEPLAASDFTIQRNNMAGLVIGSEDASLYACPDQNGNLRDLCAAYNSYS